MTPEIVWMVGGMAFAVSVIIGGTFAIDWLDRPRKKKG